MGTHPIFESDFDCLTEVARWSQIRGPLSVPPVASRFPMKTRGEPMKTERNTKLRPTNLSDAPRSRAEQFTSRATLRRHQSPSCSYAIILKKIMAPLKK